MREEFKNSDLWSKRFLPHYRASLKYQMITYRLADSLPINRLQKEIDMLGSRHFEKTLIVAKGILG